MKSDGSKTKNKSTFDINRMDKALSGPFFTVPKGLTREQKKAFIITKA